MSLILLVDDAQDVVDIVTRRLSEKGYDVINAPDGRSALSMLRNIQVDLMILDLLMPRMNGIEVLARLRGGRYERPRLLVLTAAESSEMREEALKQGADEFLTKPFDTKDLVCKIEALLGHPSPRVTQRPVIFLLDDDEDFRKMLAQRLAALGYAVEQASDAGKALLLVEIAKPDIFLIDIRMPGIDGNDACHSLKNDPRLKSIPVLMVTGDTDPAQHEKARLAGADGIVTKPVDLGALRRKIEELIVGTGTPP